MKNFMRFSYVNMSNMSMFLLMFCIFQMTLSFTCELSMSGPDYSEVMVKKNSTVASCLQCILERAKITGKNMCVYYTSNKTVYINLVCRSN
jgi:hypothetical protein